jgi:hypothetical protein
MLKELWRREPSTDEVELAARFLAGDDMQGGGEDD